MLQPFETMSQQSWNDVLQIVPCNITLKELFCKRKGEKEGIRVFPREFALTAFFTFPNSLLRTLLFAPTSVLLEDVVTLSMSRGLHLLFWLGVRKPEGTFSWFFYRHIITHISYGLDSDQRWFFNLLRMLRHDQSARVGSYLFPEISNRIWLESWYKWRNYTVPSAQLLNQNHS